MERKWIVKYGGDNEIRKKLGASLNIAPNLAGLLLQRGIESYEEARSFFRPQLSDLHDPFLMQDMDLAVNRLNQAIKNKEKIMVYGDYDVDGTTSVALVYSYLKKFHPHMGYYVPDRYNEGYGISFMGIDHALKEDYSLIIALDCGIKAIEKAKYAREKNIDLIICDHHNPGEELPDAVAVLDPKRSDCRYPYKGLSGCGVGFKLMQAYTLSNQMKMAPLYEFLDLVVVSIGSDIVPITGENRVLAKYGLQVLNDRPLIGLQTVLDLANLNDKEIVISDIVFKIGPRLNAAGRMESGSKAVALLVANDPEEAHSIGNEINEINTNRKTLDHNITDEALEMIKSHTEWAENKSTLVYSAEWHKGVIGIVASRLIENYFRPTVVLTQSNGMVSGSARSVPGFDLYSAIESCSDLLESFGGHMYAAGLTLKPERLNEFRERFEKAVASTITDDMLIPSINVDLELEVKDITPKFYRILKQFAPFGPENLKPVFVTRGVYDNGCGKKVGKSGEHLKLKIIQHLGDNLSIDAIGFGFGKYYNKITDFQAFDICFTVEENHFMGHTNLQIVIKDIKFYH